MLSTMIVETSFGPRKVGGGKPFRAIMLARHRKGAHYCTQGKRKAKG